MFTNNGFGTRTARHLDLVEVSIVPNADEPTRREARVVLEMTITEGSYIYIKLGKIGPDPGRIRLTHHHHVLHILSCILALPIRRRLVSRHADMLDVGGKMHGASIIHLVDMYVFLPNSCSRLFHGFIPSKPRDAIVLLTCTLIPCRCTTLPIAAMSLASGRAGLPGVSLNIDTIYHAPASLQVFSCPSSSLFATCRHMTTGVINSG